MRTAKVSLGYKFYSCVVKADIVEEREIDGRQCAVVIPREVIKYQDDQPEWNRLAVKRIVKNGNYRILVMAAQILEEIL